VAKGASEKLVAEWILNLSTTSAIAVAIKNENTIATPPNLGRASLCRWRWPAGAESHRLRTAKSRTTLVKTNDSNSELRKVPRNSNVNQSPQNRKPRVNENYYFDYSGAARREPFSY